MERLTRLENIKGGLTLKVESRRGALAQADENEQKLLRAIEAARQRIAMLKDLERNMDGFQSSVKAVMKAAANRRLRGITGPVSTILSVKPGYEVAIETALGFALQNIVVENETAVPSAAIGLFAGRARGARHIFAAGHRARLRQLQRAVCPRAAVLASRPCDV